METSRRSLLGIGTALGATAGAYAASPATSKPSRVHRIDVHQHVVPPFWGEALRTVAGRNPFRDPVPLWTAESAVAFMDSQHISTGILSLTAPGISSWPIAERAIIARDVNAFQADLVARMPSRFGMFATLPLPDVDLALGELAYATDRLGADGVVIFSNYGGKYLGDPLFAPLWAELDRRNCVVFVHPDRPPLAELPGTPGPFVDFPFDTTRTAVDMVLSGVMTRHPRLRVILAHGGGFLPYAAYRFSELSPAFRPGSESASELQAQFRRFYFDTALTASPAALPSLAAFADPGHILFGSDFPYAPPRVSAAFTGYLDDSRAISAAALERVNRSNALALFPRLAARTDPKKT